MVYSNTTGGIVQLELFDKDYIITYRNGDTKVCNKCEQEKPVSCFSFHSGSNYLRPECKECNNELSRIRTELRLTYGMPPSDYLCPICSKNSEQVAGKGGKAGSWVLDHCHNTNKFRGWLCHKCNRGIGNFDDNTDLLMKAVEYLKDG
jgi:hypothetical protein